MTHKGTTRLLALLSIVFLAGCSTLLKAPPIRQSPELNALVSSESSQLKPDVAHLYPFNHAWSSGYCAAEPEIPVFIAPVDASRVDHSKLIQSHLDSEDLSEITEYARRKLVGAFSKEGKNFRIVEQRPSHGRVVELSVVELTGTAVTRNILGTALGAFVPGGGLVAVRSSGTIGVEGVIKEAATGKPLLVFADRERGKTAPFSFNDFRVLSHARVAIDDWSSQIAEACSSAPGTKISDGSPITLLPI